MLAVVACATTVVIISFPPTVPEPDVFVEDERVESNDDVDESETRTKPTADVVVNPLSVVEAGIKLHEVTRFNKPAVLMLGLFMVCTVAELLKVTVGALVYPDPPLVMVTPEMPQL